MGQEKSKILFLLRYSLAIFIFISSLLFYTYKSTTLPLYSDEYERVGRTFFFAFYVHRDFDSTTWNNVYSYDTPKLPHYLFALALYPTYLRSEKIHTPQAYLYFLERHELYQHPSQTIPDWKNVQRNLSLISPSRLIDGTGASCNQVYCKSIPLILKARTISVIFAALSAVVVFVIGLQFGGIGLALLLTFLWTTNVLVENILPLVLAEGMFIFFFSTGILLCMWVYKHTAFTLRWACVIGFISAFAFSTKIHGILLLFIISIFTLLNMRKKRLKAFYWLFCVYLIFCCIVILLDPFLWKNTWSNFMMFFNHRSTVAHQQQISFPQDALLFLPERINAIFNHFFFSKEDYLQTRFIDFLPPLVKIFLFFTGVFIIMARLRKHRVFQSFSVISVVIYIFLGKFLLLDWDRYYIIGILPVIITMLVGFDFLFKNVPFAYRTIKQCFTTKRYK